MLRVVRAIGVRPSIEARRYLGSWTDEFVKTQGASLAARQELGTKLESVWEVRRDEDKARALAAEAGTPDNMLFALSVEGTTIAVLRAALADRRSGLLIGAQVVPSLSLSSVGKPLIRIARDELKLRGCEQITAVAPLPGLCDWVVAGERWQDISCDAPDFDPLSPGAVEAVAKGIPRASPGHTLHGLEREHSVLGQGTFKAARAEMTKLAMEYALASLDDADAETAMYAAQGGVLSAINWMHARDEKALRDSAGCTVTLRFE